MNGGAGGASGSEGGESGKQRVVEYVCAQRGPITVVFFLSAMFLVASLFLLAFASLSPASRVITVANVGITGTLCAVSGFVLRTCNRRREGLD